MNLIGRVFQILLASVAVITTGLFAICVFVHPELYQVLELLFPPWAWLLIWSGSIAGTFTLWEVKLPPDHIPREDRYYRDLE